MRDSEACERTACHTIAKWKSKSIFGHRRSNAAILQQAEATPRTESSTSPPAQEVDIPRRDQYWDSSDQAEDFARSELVPGLSIASG
jgi:hypothetical protein